MMKFATILKSRGYISRQLLNTNKTTQNVTGLHSLMSAAGISTAGQKYSADDRVYARYSVYKGKAALSAGPIAPIFAKIKSGITVKRQGMIMLSFTPSVGERKYDWERRQYFALSPTEVGSLISLGPAGSCEFFHDPSMKTSNAGQVRKSFSIKSHADGSGYFFSLNKEGTSQGSGCSPPPHPEVLAVADTLKKTNERFTVPVTSAEFAVMRTSFSFALPHIMGWDQYATQEPKLEENSANEGPRRMNSANEGPRRMNIANEDPRQMNSANAFPRQLNSEWNR